MKIAALQMTSGSNIDANLKQASDLMLKASQQGTDLMLLPENFAFFAKEDKDYLAYEEHFGEGRIQQFLQQQAIKHQCYVVGGTIPLVASNKGKVRTSVLMYNRQGENIGRYDKIHLFDVKVPGSDEHYKESSMFEAGDSLAVIDTEFGKVGLSVCYDLRFPEMFRMMSAQGAELFLVPAAFTKLTGQAHWDPLIKARAIENLAFVVAANQDGFHVNGRETYGHSMIIDPWGNRLANLDNGSGVVIAEINSEQQRIIREQFPVLKHRQFYCAESTEITE